MSDRLVAVDRHTNRHANAFKILKAMGELKQKVESETGIKRPQAYAPSWMVKSLEEPDVYVKTWIGPRMQHVIIEVLKLAQRDPDLKAAIETLHRFGKHGPMAIMQLAKARDIRAPDPDPRYEPEPDEAYDREYGKNER